ncbi:MAG: Asp-tRNA(Asn)/Glu-tRNA(Gln) amidotransferase subunit GatC [Thermodesulfobacteriota bacterium]
MKIKREEVEHVAVLARLRITPEEADRLTGQLNRILEYMDKLGELDVSGIEPMAHALSLATPLREDQVRPSLPPDESLANAPDRQGDFFRVPKVI